MAVASRAIRCGRGDLCSVPDARRTAACFCRHARCPQAGRTVLIEGYRPEQLNYKTGGPSLVENLYTRALLEAEFGSMSELRITEHDSMTSEGTGHVGMAALIDLVGRK